MYILNLTLQSAALLGSFFTRTSLRKLNRYPVVPLTRTLYAAKQETMLKGTFLRGYEVALPIQTSRISLLFFLPDAIGPEVVVLFFVVLGLLAALVGLTLMIFYRRR
jgi:hypothetical protein